MFTGISPTVARSARHASRSQSLHADARRGRSAAHAARPGDPSCAGVRISRDRSAASPHREGKAVAEATISNPERPMVWINEICWHEMNVDDELTLRTEDPWAQEQEREMRRTLYQWRHLPGDMIVSDYLTCPLAIHSPDFGIIEDVDIVTTDRPGENPHARGDAQPARHRTAVPGHVRPVRRHHACREGRADAHLVHPVGLPHSLVGHRRGDARRERAPSPGPRGRGAHGGRLDGGTGPVRRPEPFVAGSRQHASGREDTATRANYQDRISIRRARSE